MSYNLFIDDERYPPDDGREWKIARSYDDFRDIWIEFGMPSFVSFDHDLGENSKDGYEITKNACCS